MLNTVSRFIFVVLFAGYGLGMPASAMARDYSTDMEEIDIVTVKNTHCCDTTALKDEANVQLTMPRDLYAAPHIIEVYNERQEQVARLKTQDRVVFMRLPQGNYKVKIDAVLRQQTILVNASGNRMTSYAI